MLAVDSRAEVQTTPVYENEDAAPTPSESQLVDAAEEGGSAAAGLDASLLQTQTHELTNPSSTSLSPTSLEPSRSSSSRSRGSDNNVEDATAVPLQNMHVPGLNPILGCIFANCSVPYLTCLSSLSCSAIFDCLQTTSAPVHHCARYLTTMTPRDKKMFEDLAECEQREQCFGEFSDPNSASNGDGDKERRSLFTDMKQQAQHTAASPAPVPIVADA